MSNKLEDLITLLREEEELEAPAGSVEAEEPGEEANRVVPDAEASALIGSEVEDLDEPQGDTLIPEGDEEPASVIAAATPPVSTAPEAGEGDANLPNDAVVDADELASDLDPDVQDILRSLGESEESDDDSSSDDDSDESDSDSDDKGDEDKADGDNDGEPAFNDVDNVNLSKDELDDVVAKSSEDSPEKKEEDAPLPGSEDLSQEQKGCLRKLFDNKVQEGVKAALPKAVKLVEGKLNEKFKETVRVRDAKLNEQVSHYLTYVVESWVKKNQPAIYTATQVKAAKKIFESLRSLCENFDIETIDAKAAIVAEFETKLANEKARSNKLVSENARLVKEALLKDKAIIIDEASKSLPITKVAEFQAAVKKIKASDLVTFKENVEAMKVSFSAKAKKPEGVQLTNESLVLNGGIKGGSKVAPVSDADFLADSIPYGTKEQ